MRGQEDAHSMDVLPATTPGPRRARVDAENPTRTLAKSSKAPVEKRRGLADISNGVTPGPVRQAPSTAAARTVSRVPEVDTASRQGYLAPMFSNPNAERAIKFAATPKAWLDLPEQSEKLAEYVPEYADYSEENGQNRIDFDPADLLFA